MSDPHAIREKAREVDLLIGAVLIPGRRAPHLVTEEMVSTMRPGAVIIDVAVDQGGCIETTHPTTHQASDIHQTRHRPLLRGEYARRCWTDFDVCTGKCDPSLCSCAR